MPNLPTYTKNKMKGNIGEALVQYLLSHFCLVHKIDGSNDIGNDFICELIKDKYPTNLLFYVQVKFTKSKPRISKSTIEYWKGSPIPIYIFWIKGDPPNTFEEGAGTSFDKLPKHYLRMTPKLHSESKHKNEKYKIFSEKNFKRDLLIDYARTQYKQGLVPLLEPGDFLSLDEKQALHFPKYKLLTRKVIPEYRNEILKRGWVQPLVMANLAIDSDANNAHLIAEDSIRLARSLAQFGNPEEYEVFENLVNDLRGKIDSRPTN